MKPKLITVMTITLIATVFATPGGAYPRSGRTTLVTNTHPRALPDPHPDIQYWGGITAINADGRYVAFSSPFSDLVESDLNLIPDVFVRDLVGSSTEIVSISSDGVPAIGPPEDHGGSKDPSISSSGRYVAFHSSALNLVIGDTNLRNDVFVHDRRDGSTERVSISSDEEEASGESTSASLSANGRFVAFESHAANLVESDTNGVSDVFVRDRAKGRTVRVSVDSGAGQAESHCSSLLPVPAVPSPLQQCKGGSGGPSISGDGRYVVFWSDAANLVEQDTNGQRDLFVHDLKAGKTKRVNVASDGSESQPMGPFAGLTFGLNRAISSDGRYVFFGSGAGNLVPNDPPGDAALPDADAFVHDTKTGRTERVNVTSSGEESQWSPSPTQLCPGSGAAPGAITPDGRHVVFTSPAANLHPREQVSNAEVGVSCDQAQVFIFDRKVGAIGPASVDDSGDLAKDCTLPTGITAHYASVSAQGRHVAFWSCDDSLSSDDKHHNDVFVRDRGLPLGVGGFGGSAREPDEGDEPLICIESICIPPQSAVSLPGGSGRDTGVVLTERGADLIGGAIAYRPSLGDLYVSLELESMPRTPALAAATAGILYGMSFEADGRSYEIRATSTGLGSRGETTATFGLFSCKPGKPLCTKVTDIEGGFGTTGERITFSVPLSEIEVQAGSPLTDVKGFTALGAFASGAQVIYDHLKIR